MVFDRLRDVVLPSLACKVLERKDATLRCWSIGCASDEEPYTLQLVWLLAVQAHFPPVACHILDTDAGSHLLARAISACYPASSLRELLQEWRTTAFAPQADDYCLRLRFRQGVDFKQQDIRTAAPDGNFDLILCRNMVFTYFDEPGQQQALTRILERLQPGGVLVIGKSEQLPAESRALNSWDANLRIYRRH